MAWLQKQKRTNPEAGAELALDCFLNHALRPEHALAVVDPEAEHPADLLDEWGTDGSPPLALAPKQNATASPCCPQERLGAVFSEPAGPR